VIAQKVKSIKAAKSPNERPRVTLDDDSQIEPLLLVGSDGEKSLTRTEYNIGIWG
jgi:2-polyprenyl-6-methoxyphenol hydroxylase-like FAD-dependent oxidoreductase